MSHDMDFGESPNGCAYKIHICVEMGIKVSKLTFFPSPSPTRFSGFTMPHHPNYRGATQQQHQAEATAKPEISPAHRPKWVWRDIRHISVDIFRHDERLSARMNNLINFSCCSNVRRHGSTRHSHSRQHIQVLSLSQCDSVELARMSAVDNS